MSFQASRNPFLFISGAQTMRSDKQVWTRSWSHSAPGTLLLVPTWLLSTMTLLHLLVPLLSLGTICCTDLFYFVLKTAVLMALCDLSLLLAGAVELQTSNMTREVLRNKTFTDGNCKFLSFVKSYWSTCWFVWWKICFKWPWSFFLHNQRRRKTEPWNSSL